MAEHPGDLFELAHDPARLVGSPITIEDRDTVVIAYGGEHSAADRARRDDPQPAGAREVPRRHCRRRRLRAAPARPTT
ncbi:hypothetical protein [Nocardioides sp. B-3]|uniref:hypothetical protein n=1 Tax=Nocardioides sp. B-3 TaxID=2895565 RepID=UPI0021521C06|nr:hypothetical protein [Nocardioides sp. B-3]UUZ59677.1 hypothetical protein LP418_00550 [Nocardioides sp. B-3]